MKLNPFRNQRREDEIESEGESVEWEWKREQATANSCKKLTLLQFSQATHRLTRHAPRDAVAVATSLPYLNATKVEYN